MTHRVNLLKSGGVLMNIMIFGASGFIGSTLSYALGDKNTLILVSRSKKRILNGNHTTITWSELAKNSEILKNVDVIVNLCGQSIFGIWTKSYKRRLHDSRTTPLKTIASLLDKHDLSTPIVTASGIGIYGYQDEVDLDHLPPALDENSETQKPYFLSELGNQLENALPEKHKKNTCYLRFGVILDTSGGSLPIMMLPHYFYMGTTLGSGAQPLSWVSLHDAVHAIEHAINNSLKGAYNVVGKCQTMQSFNHDLAKAMHRRSFLKCPKCIAKHLGGMIENTVLRGQNISSKKLCNTGFKFNDHSLEKVLGRKK